MSPVCPRLRSGVVTRPGGASGEASAPRRPASASGAGARWPATACRPGGHTRSGHVVCDHSSHLSESPLGDRVCQLGEYKLENLQGDVGEIQKDIIIVFLIPDNVIRGPHH